jgi:hypothetical protein
VALHRPCACHASQGRSVQRAMLLHAPPALLEPSLTPVVPALAVAALPVIIVLVDQAVKLHALLDSIALRQPLRLHARRDIIAPLVLSIRRLARLVFIVLKVARHLSAAQQAT